MEVNINKVVHNKTGHPVDEMSFTTRRLDFRPGKGNSIN